MDIDTVYTTLRNAGFIVSLSGMSFVVRLKNRDVRPMEVRIALNWPDNVSYRVSGKATIVYVD